MMKSSVLEDIQRIQDFLGCQTPQAWLDAAVQNIEILLIDHAHCERKAASSALHLLYRYPDKERLLVPLARLAREELKHFEQVLSIMRAKGYVFVGLKGSRYAHGLLQHASTAEPARLVDTLIVSAFIEARSCERFYALSNQLRDAELTEYYRFLLRSEARHFQDYLQLAEHYGQQDLTDRLNYFRHYEKQLIEQSDVEFRFHSGVPSG